MHDRRFFSSILCHAVEHAGDTMSVWHHVQHSRQVGICRVQAGSVLHAVMVLGRIIADTFASRHKDIKQANFLVSAGECVIMRAAP